MNFRLSFLFCLLMVIALGITSKAQENNGNPASSAPDTENPFGQPDKDFSLIRETPVTINLEQKTDSLELDLKKKKKKRKKNVFYGLKTKKRFAKSGYGDNETVELFHVLKEFKKPDPYVPDIYWYDYKRRQIRHTGTPDPKHGAILHGPYKKLVGDQVVEEGIFYIGTKNGRWTQYDKNDVLISKKKYYHGWPKESLVRYYDKDPKHLKEVIPVQYGKKEGTYYRFHENGSVAVKGEYEDDVKVGNWTEYYDFRNRHKKEVQYAEDPYEKDFKPYITREWNRQGQLVYDHSKP